MPAGGDRLPGDVVARGAVVGAVTAGTPSAVGRARVASRSSGRSSRSWLDVGLVDVTQPPRLAHDGGLEEGADEAAVAEPLVARRRREDLAQVRDRRVGRGEVGARGDAGEDLDELVVAVVVELQREPEAALETRVRRDEAVHRLRVAGDDHDAARRGGPPSP